MHLLFDPNAPVERPDVERAGHAVDGGTARAAQAEEDAEGIRAAAGHAEEDAAAAGHRSSRSGREPRAGAGGGRGDAARLAAAVPEPGERPEPADPTQRRHR